MNALLTSTVTIIITWPVRSTYKKLQKCWGWNFALCHRFNLYPLYEYIDINSKSTSL